ncbi:hypothetical protein ACFLTA_04870 [Bacteroidota bacterium]
MKTTSRTNTSLPTPFRFSAYIFAVAVICFINWAVLKAADPANSETHSLESRLAIALIEESDPVMELEDWMLNFADDYLAENTESEIALETWMYDYDAFCSVDTEVVQTLKDWMVNTDEWSSKTFLAEK